MTVATLSVTSVQVERPTITTDAMGGTVKTWATVLTTKCRFQPLSSREQIMHSKDESRIVAKAYFDQTPNIIDGDRLKIRTYPFSVESQYFYVKGVRNIDNLGRFTTLELEGRDQSG